MAATTAAALAELVRGAVRGDSSRLITGAAGLDQAGPGDVTYIVDEKHLSGLKTTQAGACILAKKFAPNTTDVTNPILILVEDALDSFLIALQEFRPRTTRPAIEVSAEAHVSPTAICGADCSIQAGATICDGARIGTGCDIYPGVYVGPGCQIGDNCVLYPNVVLYPGVILGNRVIIHSGAVLGADGFGYRFREGRFEKIPQLGSVEIQDDCEIGANATIDRGMIGATVIGRGTKLDNLVMIGHNCQIGQHNAFASQVGLAGSVTTGDYVRMAGQVGIADHVHIGQAAVVGAKAGVHNDLAAAQSYLGAPARPEGEAIRILMAQTKLPDMRKQLRELEQQVAALQKQLETLLPSRMAS